MKYLTINSNNLNIDQLCLLHLIKKEVVLEDIKKQLEENGYLNKNGKVTIKGRKELINSLKYGESTSKEIEELAHKYRNLFKGLKIGSMGNLDPLIQKLSEFKRKYEYTNNQILEAAQDYIDSLNGDYIYLQRPEYTVNKKLGDGTAESRLLMFCEELENKSNNKEEGGFYDII